MPNFSTDGQEPIDRALVTYLLVHALNVPSSNVGLKFTDMPEGTWYAPAVQAAVAEGIINGTTPTTFSPGADLTRAQVAAILARALHLPLTSGQIPFHDVPANAWYAKDVAALHAAGLINGVSPTAFDPNGTITTAQTFALIDRTEAYIASGK